MYVLGFNQWNPEAPWVVVDRTKNKEIEYHQEKETAEARCLELNRSLPPQPTPRAAPKFRFHTVVSMRKELAWMSQPTRDALVLGSEERRRRRIEAETGVRQPTKMMPETLPTATKTITADSMALTEKNAALLEALSQLPPEKWEEVFRDLPPSPPEAPNDPAKYAAGLRELRERYGISRMDLADAAEAVSEKTIQRIESGQRFHIKSLWAIARGMQKKIRTITAENSVSVH